ncbi:FYVE, RhoGEF and PH domain-containing protein 6 [Trichoplax sp. H2]|nr:FYVE, RhoGEF and PH domain-containing protein 6 [Trichoplax sp. H2]|eukprot:RDD37688.1 FYVE, RhoGEF and PH domain-containing protein 6 [Trichoplax sp. H2]
MNDFQYYLSQTYTTYVSDYEKTNTLLQETMKIHPEFATAVQVFQTSRCKNLTISSYMLKPIQRIPRYRLLMEDYLKNLPADSEELPDAQSALASIIDAANKINENMKIGDNLKKILRVQERLRIRKDYNLVVPHRIYIKEGLLGKVCRKVVQIRMFFLFSDILLYTEPEAVTHSFRYKDEFDLKNMQITIPTDQNLYGESFAFQINHKKRQFILKAKSIEERDEWVKELQTAAEEERNRLATFGENVAMPKTFIIGKQAPLMIADDHVTRCQICDKMFTTFFRRHHCRGCGKVVCGECSNNKAPLEYKDYKADRVCDACYEILLSGLTERINNRPTDHYPILEYQYERRDEVVTRFRKHSSKTGTKIRRRKDRCSFLKEETGNAYSLKDPVDVSNKGDFKNWKRKFCIVRGNENVLYIYDAVEDKKAAKEVVLVGWTISKKTIAKEDDSTSTDNIIELSHFNQSSADAPVSPNHNANQLMFIRPPADKFNEWFDCILKATQLTDPRDSVFGESTDI